MLHLRDVLQLVVDALYDGALAEQDLVGVSFNYFVKNLAEIVDNAENFSNFVVGQYHDIVYLSY